MISREQQKEKSDALFDLFSLIEPMPLHRKRVGYFLPITPL